MHKDLFPETLLVSVAEGKPYTTSLLVAQHFHKRHKNIIQAIENLLSDPEEAARSGLKFQPANYLDAQNKPRLMYRMDRKAMSVLVGRFSGPLAMRWQCQYHDAFTTMEAELQARTTRYADALHQVRPALRPVVDGTEQGLSRSAIAQPLGKSAGAVTYHRSQARRLGLLAKPAAVAA